MAGNDNDPFPGLRGVVSWLREQFSEPDKSSDADEERPLTRQEVVTVLGRDPFPEWFEACPKSLWPDTIYEERVQNLKEYSEGVAESRAELERHPVGSWEHEDAKISLSPSG